MYVQRICQRCGSTRVPVIMCHTHDCSSVSLGDDIEHDYVPDDFINIGGGDPFFQYCLACGQMQGEWPTPKTWLEKERDNRYDY